MKAILRLLAVVLPLIAPACAQAASSYVNRPFLVGDNLFANPLTNANNTLSEMFPTAPVGTSVSLLNPLTLTYDSTSIFDGASWSSDLTLLPGTGARLIALSGFTATFFGQPLNHDGSPLSDPIVLASPYSGPAGIFLLGDKCPISASGDDIFLNVLGRTPILGEQITLLDEATPTYTTSTSLGGGAWDIFPIWSVSDAAFFRVSVVPEPGIIILGLTGLGFLEFWRRWQKLPTARK